MYTYFDRMIMEIWNDDMVLGINGDKMRSGKFIRFASSRPETLHQFAIWLKDQDAWSFVVHYDDMSWAIDSNAFGTWKLQMRRT